MTDLAAEQLVERHVGAFPLDVPERDVDAAHRVEQHRAVPPVRAHVTRLPDVFDLVDVPPDQERLEILLERGLDDERTLGEGRAAPADEPRLGRLHLHDHQPDVVRGRHDRLDVPDLDRCGAGNSLCESGVQKVGGEVWRYRLGDRIPGQQRRSTGHRERA